MFTYNDIIGMARLVTHRNAADSAHTTVMQNAMKLALAAMSRYTGWYFTGVELKLTVDAGARLYAFPTLDQQGNTIVLANMDKQSFRFSSITQVAWEDDVKQIDYLDPTWTDGLQGTVEYVTISAGKIALYRQPSEDFATDNPYLYFRGWRQIVQPNTSTGTDDYPTSGTAPSFAANIADVPGDWQEVLVPGVIAWTYKQARAQAARVKAEMDTFYGALSEMQAKCVPAVGFSRSNLAPAPQFVNGPTGYDVRDDYGLFSR